MGVLDGIRILELARVAPAEMPAMMLADMGAEVLKIETPEPGREPERRVGPPDDPHLRQPQQALDDAEPEVARGPGGLPQARRRPPTSSSRASGPGVMKRLGADYETLHALNPRLVYCSLSGFGQDGPYRDVPAHDMNYLSLAGVLGLIGEPDRKPVIPLNLVADYAGASLHGALGIMLALFARERTGRGQHVDVSYLDTTVSLLAATPNMRFFFSDGVAPRRGEGFLGGSYPYYAIYETRDGKLLTIGCTEPWLWENFCNGDRATRTSSASRAARSVRARGQRRGRGGAPRDRGAHQDPRPRRLVRAPRQGRRLRGQGLRRSRDGRRPADQPSPMVVDVEHPTHGTGAAVRRRHQALRHARADPQRGAPARRAHRERPEGSRHDGRGDRRAPTEGSSSSRAIGAPRHAGALRARGLGGPFRPPVDRQSAVCSRRSTDALPVEPVAASTRSRSGARRGSPRSPSTARRAAFRRAPAGSGRTRCADARSGASTGRAAGGSGCRCGSACSMIV